MNNRYKIGDLITYVKDGCAKTSKINQIGILFLFLENGDKIKKTISLR